MTKPVTIEDYHSAQESHDRALMEHLRSVIDAGLPDAEAKLWHAHPVWFLGGNPIVGYSLLKNGVRLMFWSGQTFESPGLQPSGSFKAAQRCYQGLQDVDDGQLRGWLSESRTVQWDCKNIVKRRGRLERLC